jgi:hypothetical protein
VDPSLARRFFRKMSHRPLQNLPILTAGETDGFLDAGGLVHFAFGETLQFDLTTENHPHLKVRSNLATLARRLVNKLAAKDR